ADLGVRRHQARPRRALPLDRGRVRHPDRRAPLLQHLRHAPVALAPLHLPTALYAVTKRDHEELFLSIGASYDIPTVALRYFNTYGTRQSLSNPYTGVIAIFSSRLLDGNPPMWF